MPQWHDATGVRWHVYRRWWPFNNSVIRSTTMSGDSAYGLVQLIIALPFLLVWPFWVLTRLCGAPWTVVVARAGVQVHSERVRGWTASGLRIAELAQR